MKATLEIYELKILKGPDKLLRLHVVIQDSLDMPVSLQMLEAITSALIWKHHQLHIDFPAEQLLAAIPESEGPGSGKYGTFDHGILGLEILLCKQTASSFKIRYYPEDLEFERNVVSVKRHLRARQTELEDYAYKYTGVDFRNGFEVSEFSTTISYRKDS